ncbi:RNA polymerase sigma factor [Acetivibrio cellulolyticus]|uniref:RNA polymerase sigma factor n=1 Tax=Acetivibrio cellulolyticus TaxID=35830 RepID=UPI0001E2D50A|nr:RNA polymerase sigma factor [Acetivibrio cellulolyticus]
MDVPDQKIIKLCKKNKREGFDLLFKKYERYIYTICYSYTYSQQDALDLVQEIFLRIYRNFERVDEKKPISPWIKRIAVNVCINFKRDNKNKVSELSIHSSTDEGENTLEETVSDGCFTEDEVVYLDTKKVLEESIMELPKEVKMAVLLRHIKGLSYNEISELMECPVGTIKTYIFRGKKLLKDSLVRKGVWEV